MLKVLIGFFVGAAVGTAAALLLAPSSGEDMRHQMHDQADADMQQMRAEYRRGMDDLHSMMDKMSADLSATVHKSGEIEESAGSAPVDPTPGAA